MVLFVFQFSPINNLIVNFGLNIVRSERVRHRGFIIEAGNQEIPPATPQVIAAYYFDKLHQLS